MSLTYKIIIAIIAVLVSQWLASDTFETTLAFILIILFGIPHGATDHVLHNLIKEGKINKLPKIDFLAYYLGAILAYGFLWYFFPSVSLLIFLVISAFHFGETQLIKAAGKDWQQYLIWCAWGSTALLILFFPHIAEIEALISPWLVSQYIMDWVASNDYYLLLFNFTILLIALFFQGWKMLMTQVFELMLLFALSYFSSLLLSFAIFFAFWHSRDATFLQLEKIKSHMKDFRLKSWISLALPYTIVSLIGIATIVLFVTYTKIDFPLVTLFFILVALITLPHVFVMSRFYRS